MKLATLLLFTGALLAGPTPQAQNQNVIEPGDVLVVKLVSKWELPISRIVAVMPDGKLRLPLLPGMMPGEVSVGGLGLGEAAQKLEQSYLMLTSRGKTVRVEASGKKPPLGPNYFQVVVERGTVDQLLRE
jgi:protein involved in polysaccharide export with SLBB domain